MYIPTLTVIAKIVFIGPAAAFTNDPDPMSPKRLFCGAFGRDACSTPFLIMVPGRDFVALKV